MPDQGGRDKKVLAVDEVLYSGLDVGWTSVVGMSRWRYFTVNMVYHVLLVLIPMLKSTCIVFRISRAVTLSSCGGENLYDSVQVGLTRGIEDQTRELCPTLVLEDKEH